MDNMEACKIIFKRLIESDDNLKPKNITDEELIDWVDDIVEHMDKLDKDISDNVDNISFGKSHPINISIIDNGATLHHIPIMLGAEQLGYYEILNNCIVLNGNCDSSLYDVITDDKSNRNEELLSIINTMDNCGYDEPDHRYKDKFFSKQNMKRRKIKNKKRHR